MSYSVEIKKNWRENADYRSQLSGVDTRPLQCSHNTHLKDIMEYNDSNYGLLVTDIEHYTYHLIFRNSPYVEDVLGLTYSQNLWSLDAMWQDIVCMSQSLGWNKHMLLDQIEKAKLYWYAFLAIDPIEG